MIEAPYNQGRLASYRDAYRETMGESGTLEAMKAYRE